MEKRSLSLSVYFFAILVAGTISLAPKKACAWVALAGAITAIETGAAAGGSGLLGNLSSSASVAATGGLIYTSYKGVKYVVSEPQPEELSASVISFCQSFHPKQLELFILYRDTIRSVAEKYIAFIHGSGSDTNLNKSSQINQALVIIKANPQGAELAEQLTKGGLSSDEVDEFLLKSIKQCL
jgi:hypothetical protein